MDVGHFYFINDRYFIDFPDPCLMRNKETIAGTRHGRPCFYTFCDVHHQIYWVIPISHEIIKYTTIYQHKLNKYGICDTIVFGNVLGKKKAFLIQNMCPVISNYISGEYIDSKANLPVGVDGAFEKELIQKAKKVLALIRKGKKLVIPDVLKIEEELKKQLNL